MPKVSSEAYIKEYDSHEDRRAQRKTLPNRSNVRRLYGMSCGSIRLEP